MAKPAAKWTLIVGGLLLIATAIVGGAFYRELHSESRLALEDGRRGNQDAREYFEALDRAKGVMRHDLPDAERETAP